MVYVYEDGWHSIAGIQAMVRGGKVAWLDGGISIEKWNRRTRRYENFGGKLSPRAMYGQLARGNLRFRNSEEFAAYAESIGVEIKRNEHEYVRRAV